MVALSAATIKATGQTTKMPLSQQLYQRINVKGFGAVGDGIADDTANILAAMNWAANVSHGTIFFPPGTYRITRPIQMLENNDIAYLEGTPGTTIVGNFNDYLIRFCYSDLTFSGSQRGIIECMRLINTHPTGGGIKYATVVGGHLRDLIITANRGINTAIDDNIAIGFEVSIHNCHLDPGANKAGSVGLRMGSDGPVLNCSFTGFATGAISTGGQGCANFLGCRYELCDIGFGPNSGLHAVNGNYFLNCGSAIRPTNLGTSYVCGNIIEAWEGTIAGNPQYGIFIPNDKLTRSIVGGLTIRGQYQVAGFAFQGSEQGNKFSLVIATGVSNTGTLGVTTRWVLPTTTAAAEFLACDVIPVFAYTTALQARHITNASYDTGTNRITVTFSPTTSWGGSGYREIKGITVAGNPNTIYNGIYFCQLTSGTTARYPRDADPAFAGGSDPGGPLDFTNASIAVAHSVSGSQTREGDEYNLNNANAAVWGADIVPGAPNLHVKARWNGSNWTTVGK